MTSVIKTLNYDGPQVGKFAKAVGSTHVFGGYISFKTVVRLGLHKALTFSNLMRVVGLAMIGLEQQGTHTAGLYNAPVLT